jgi:hypothetical protein
MSDVLSFVLLLPPFHMCIRVTHVHIRKTKKTVFLSVGCDAFSSNLLKFPSSFVGCAPSANECRHFTRTLPVIASARKTVGIHLFLDYQNIYPVVFYRKKCYSLLQLQDKIIADIMQVDQSIHIFPRCLCLSQ